MPGVSGQRVRRRSFSRERGHRLRCLRRKIKLRSTIISFELRSRLRAASLLRTTGMSVVGSYCATTCPVLKERPEFISNRSKRRHRPTRIFGHSNRKALGNYGDSALNPVRLAPPIVGAISQLSALSPQWSPLIPAKAGIQSSNEELLFLCLAKTGSPLARGRAEHRGALRANLVRS